MVREYGERVLPEGQVVEVWKLPQGGTNEGWILLVLIPEFLQSVEEWREVFKSLFYREKRDF